VGEDGTIYDLLSENETYTKRAKECTYLMVQAFKTAGKLFQPIENDQQTVLVPFGDEGQELIEELINTEERNIGQRKHLLDKLKPYTISVYAYQMRILEECQGIYFYYDGKIVVLDSSYYSDNIGLIADKEEVKRDCSILIL
jgi:CRISPR-associated endonuclease/helicase Cas3